MGKKKLRFFKTKFLSGNPDLNRGPQVPQTCTLTNCAIARNDKYSIVKYKKCQ